MKKKENIAGINVSGTFPDTIAIDETVAGLLDGTQMFADWLTEDWGWQQDVMDRANLTPSGNPDIAGASQISEAIRLSKGIPGEIMAYMGDVLPTLLTNPPRVLPLQGDLILVADYQDLVDTCWIGSGTNATATGFYRTDATDTTRSNTGTHFRLPDMNGHFLRMVDETSLVDPDGYRQNGQSQAHGMATHRHILPVVGDTGTPRLGIYDLNNLPGDCTSTPSFVGSGTLVHYDTISGSFSATIGTTSGGRIVGYNGTPDTPGGEVGETRPLNTTCYYMIWY
jgi:hypothetical protein